VFVPYVFAVKAGLSSRRSATGLGSDRLNHLLTVESWQFPRVTGNLVASDIINELLKFRQRSGSYFVAHIKGITGDCVPAAGYEVVVQNVAFI
jgi:hypothetical protein